MKASDLILRCYARKEDNVWVAVCIDLCLAAQGSTLVDAKQKLHDMVHSYIEDAFGTDSAYAAQLLQRKAPTSQIIRYHWILFLTKWMHLKNNIKAFVEVLPLKLASH